MREGYATHLDQAGVAAREVARRGLREIAPTRVVRPRGGGEGRRGAVVGRPEERGADHLLSRVTNATQFFFFSETYTHLQIPKVKLLESATMVPARTFEKKDSAFLDVFLSWFLRRGGLHNQKGAEGMTWNFSVSMNFPGPIICSHQPGDGSALLECA